LQLQRAQRHFSGPSFLTRQYCACTIAATDGSSTSKPSARMSFSRSAWVAGIGV
jgi:hypothetical protein